MAFVRDAFLFADSDDENQFQSQLLHLIELQSGDWQLSPDAVTYYFPASKEVPSVVVV